MRKVIAAASLSLDGVMQAPGGSKEHPIGGFKHGGWSFHYWDDTMGEVMEPFCHFWMEGCHKKLGQTARAAIAALTAACPFQTRA